MKEKEQILLESAKEYYKSAETSLKNSQYNSAVVLFFKSLIAFSDLYLLRKTGESPSSHNARFRMLQEITLEVYNLVDKDFPFYQDSYVQRMSKELAEVIKDDARTVAKKMEIEV